MGLLTFAINVTLDRLLDSTGGMLWGPMLFTDWRASRLTLVETKRFKSGVTALRYALA